MMRPGMRNVGLLVETHWNHGVGNRRLARWLTTQLTTNLSFHCHIREKLKESSRTQWPDTPAAVVPQAIPAQRTEKEREQ
jgi:hypothetical protein